MIDMNQLQPWATTQQNQPNPYGDSLMAPDSGGYNPYGNDYNWQDQMNPGGLGTDAGGQYGPAENTGYGLDNSGFLFPSEWNTGTAMYNAYGSAQVPTPSSWQTGMNALTPMAQTGQPVSSGDWWKTTQDVTNRSIQDAIKNASEQAGLGGMRWSTPLGYTAQDIAGKYQGEAAQQWADREMAAQEAARQRQLAATGQLYNYGQGQYQMTQDQLARQAAAAANAIGMGTKKANMAMDVAQMMYGMGGGMQGSQQNAINNSYNNPYANMAQGYLGQQMAGMPQTYDPSLGSDILGIAGAAGQYYLNNQNQGGGAGATDINPYWNPSSSWTW